MISTAQPSTPSGFERVATSAWRSVQGHLPKRIAEAIRVPTKRALAKVGLIRSV